MFKADKIGPAIEAFIAWTIRVALYFGMAAVILLMLITVVHSVGRYVFDKPVPGIIELSGYLLVMAVFLIAAYAMINKRHITIGLLIDNRSVRTQAIIDSITFFMAFLFTSAASWQTLLQGSYMMKQGQASAILHIPNFPFYYVVGAGWFLFSLALLIHLVRAVRRAIKG